MGGASTTYLGTVADFLDGGIIEGTGIATEALEGV